MSAQSFIAQIAPIVVQLRLEGSPIFPSVRIAQCGLETGWKIPAWNNLGGYKVGSGTPNEYWRGAVVHKGSWEIYDGKRVDIVAAFRAYDSIEDFFRDHDLLFQLKRYDRVRAAKTPEEQADMLQACGYATDPQYAAKLKTIIKQYGLKKYDEEVDKVLEDLKKKIEGLSKEIQELKKLIPAPKWFVEEFGSADLDGLIHDPKFTSEGWRAIAVALRAIKKKNG